MLERVLRESAEFIAPHVHLLQMQLFEGLIESRSRPATLQSQLVSRELIKMADIAHNYPIYSFFRS